MKKIILALLSLLIVVSCCMPIMADDELINGQDKAQRSFNAAYTVSEYLFENLDPSYWGTLKYMSGPYIVIGVSDAGKIPEIREFLEQTYKKFKFGAYSGGNTDFFFTTEFTSCKYSYKKLQSIVSSIQDDPIMKKTKNKIELSLGWDGFIRVNTAITDPAVKELLYKYKSIMVFSQPILC